MSENMEHDVNEISNQSDHRSVRIEKYNELVAEGNNPFDIQRYRRTHMTKQVIDNYEKLEGSIVTIAGRIMSKREHGKASFCHVMDIKGQIQVYIRMDELGEEPYERFKTLDLGDIIGIEGEVFTTKRGEISLKAKKLTLLSKSFLPLPEKWHGLKDVDLRYRQRYIDLIVNPEVKRNFIIRSKMIKAIRGFLDARGYLEVETPILHNTAGGAAARPFVTHHNTLDIDLYLRIATELHLKRLIVGGLEKVYEIGRIFRNEGMSIKHNPEFTMIELYEAYSDYNDMMDLTEALVVNTAKEVLGNTVIEYMDTEIDLSLSWERITMVAAIKKYTDIDFSHINSLEQAKKAIEKLHINIDENDSVGNIINKVFEEYVEEHLIQPTFIIQYPVEISPLAKRIPENPGYTYRFELFIYGREIANAFSELNDPVDQKQRFEKQAKERERGNEEAHMMDVDYINALEYGMPPTGGLGIGIDRLVMLFTNSYSIRDVVLFPTMRPL